MLVFLKPFLVAVIVQGSMKYISNHSKLYIKSTAAATFAKNETATINTKVTYYRPQQITMCIVEIIHDKIFSMIH